MTHSDSKQTLEVASAQVPMYETQGWSVKRPPKKKAPTKTAAPAKDKE